MKENSPIEKHTVKRMGTLGSKRTISHGNHIPGLLEPGREAEGHLSSCPSGAMSQCPSSMEMNDKTRIAMVFI